MKYTKHIIPVFIILMLTAFCASAFVSVPTIMDGIGFQYQDITIGDNRIQIGDTNITKEATFVIAASNSLHKKGADFICDGVADQIEINTMLNNLPTGGNPFFMAGVYNCSGQINLVDNVHLWGAGAGTIFRFDGSATHGFYAAGKSNIEISNICIDNVLGMGGANYRGMIDFVSSSSKYSVHDVLIKNASGDVVGILTDNCNNFKYHNNIFDTCEMPLRACTSDHYKVCDNNFIGLSHSGLGLCCAQYAEISGNTFDGSTPYETRGDIWIGEYYRNSHDINIHHNIIKTTRGIRFIGDGGNGHDLSRINIENNIIITTGEAVSNPEMAIAPSTSVLSDIIIKDNIISGAAKGIHFDNYATMDFTIRDNTFTECTTEIDIEAGITTDIQRNQGYVTENSGTATLASGTTSIAVTHGLAVTPTAGDIMVTAMESLGSASYYYIDTYTSTTFNVTVNADPTQDVDFAWSATVY